MKRVLILIAFAVSAFAGVTTSTSVSHGNVEATAKAAGLSATYKTKTTSLRQDLGYEWKHVRAAGYVQVDKYTNDVVADTEGNAVSYGFEVDYIKKFDNDFGFFVGGVYGLGSKDLGSEGEAVGIDKMTFTDAAIRTGVTYTLDSWQLEAGVENKLRNYNDETVSGITIELEEEIQTLFVGVGYKF